MNAKSLILGLLALALPCFGQADDLFFSEYVEGSSFNKAIEIYNGTGATVDLTNYTIELYSNGNAAPNNTDDLTNIAATIADGDVLVIVNGSSEQALLDLSDGTSGVVNFNGDDAVVLKNNGVIIDVIGVIGVDPGSQWGGGSIATANDTIRRLDTVCSGDIDGFVGNENDLSGEWAGFPQNTYDGLGAHFANCGGNVNAPVMITCGADAMVPLGDGGVVATVTATDADGVIDSITITDIQPAPAAGMITAENFTAGDPASVDVVLTTDVPAGVYAVTLQAANTDNTPQTDDCTLIVNVIGPPAGMVLNEFLADPAADLPGDANGDGVRGSTDDEFVEIVNQTGEVQDISGFTLSDGVGERHVFPMGSIVEAGRAIVVFGGGTPTGTFGGAIVQTASTGQLGLNNGGDTITLQEPLPRGENPSIGFSVIYGGEGGNDQSLNLSPELTGIDYELHSNNKASGGALFSPGTLIDGTPFGPPTESLFFSEYLEGSSNNKAYEIYNATMETADLSEYVVELYSNGSNSPGNTLDLSTVMPTLGPGEVIVIANSSASQNILDVADATSSTTFYNGDDALVLRRNGDIVDMIGVVGSDPGSEWGSGDISTGENTIRRLPNICIGNPDGFLGNETDLSGEWEGFAQNTADGLGSHIALCGLNAPVTIDCNSPAGGAAGEVLEVEVSAEDLDGFILDIEILEINPVPASGTITINFFNEVRGEIGPATATVVVSADVPAGTYDVTIQATSDEIARQTAECTLVITLQEPVTIPEIQGDGLQTPLLDQFVIVEPSVVTALTDNGFYMQTPPPMLGRGVDPSPNASQGIFVFTNDAPTVSVGDLVAVSGTAEEFFDHTQVGDGVSVEVISSGNPLPDPVALDATTPSPNQPQSEIELERFEGMLVRVQNGFVVGPTDQFGDTKITSGGQRVFREPGIEFPGLPNLPVWDGNPEVFELVVDGAGLPAVPLAVGDTFDATGPLGFAFGDYGIQATSFSLTNLIRGEERVFEATPVRDRQPGEITVASQNMLRLFSSDNDYQDRLGKFSLLFREVLKAPDVIALQEVGDIGVLNDIATRLNADDNTLNYVARLEEGNDVGGIDVGFLVRDTITINSTTQLQAADTFFFDGQDQTLHDRPPLLLDATYSSPNGPFNFKVLVVHNRSLSNIDDEDDGDRVREKRLQQALGVAQIVQDEQTNNPNVNLIVLGDFNAFEFTDGYVDSMGVITGDLDPLGALLPGTDNVDPDLINLIETLPAEERYTFNFGGASQVLDHILISQNLDRGVTGFEIGRANADFPRSVEDDFSTPVRASDHDGPVVFLTNPVEPAIAVSTTSIEVDESGTTASIFVELSTVPSDTVTISVSVDDTTEASISVTELVIPGGETRGLAPEIVVTGLADEEVDTDQMFTVILGPAVSTDPNYNGLDPDDVNGINLDVDMTDDYSLELIPGDPVMVDGPPNGEVGLYVFQDGQWVFVENIMLDENGEGTGTTDVDPNATYGIGATNGSAPPVIGTTAVPTLGEWAMIAFLILMAATGIALMRRRRLA